jgi:large subunit ribosomal protein L31
MTRFRRQWQRMLEKLMAKEGIHPPYHSVVFKDSSTGTTVLTRSTMTSEQTIKMEDGNEYPLILLEITADSHPFYTGTQRLIDTQGRVDKFKKRYNR